MAESSPVGDNFWKAALSRAYPVDAVAQNDAERMLRRLCPDMSQARVLKRSQLAYVSDRVSIATF